MKDETFDALARGELEQHRQGFLYADLQKFKQGEYRELIETKLASCERRLRWLRVLVPLYALLLIGMQTVSPGAVGGFHLLIGAWGLGQALFERHRWKRTSQALERLEAARRMDESDADDAGRTELVEPA